MILETFMAPVHFVDQDTSTSEVASLQPLSDVELSLVGGGQAVMVFL